MYPKNVFTLICFLLPFTQLTALTDHEVISAWWSKACLERRAEAKRGVAFLDLIAKAQSERQKSSYVEWEHVNAAEACNFIVAPEGCNISVLNNIKQQSGLSLAGELYLAKSLLHPETNIATLRKRQAIIESLYSDNTLLASCHAIKENYGNALEKAISLHTINQDKIRNHCFSERAFTWFGKKNGLAIPSFLDGALYNGFMALQSALTVQHIMNSFRRFPAELAQSSLEHSQHFLRSVWNSAVLGSSIGGNIMTLITIALRYDLLLKKVYEYQDLKSISRDLYQAYYQVLEGAYAIRDLSQQYPILLNMETFTNLELFEKAVKENKDLKRCVKLIKAGPNSLWAYEQQTLITLLQDHKDAFAGIFEFIAEFETYIALAQLKHHFDAQKVHLCLATFREDNDSSLNLTNFWNPLLDPTKAIPNSITFDTSNRHMILTGSNTGGKSTLIKACLANLIFAQTYGLAFADALTITPFEHILASLNIVDNTSLGVSLFLSEIKRAKRIVDITQMGKKSFIVCDELFTGAAAANAGRAVAAVLQKIAQEPKSVSLFATHHGETVTNLGMQKPFFNMKIDAVKTSDGSIQYTYKCVPGISSENIADDLLRIHLGV